MDIDFSGDFDNCKSCIGFVYILGFIVIVWGSYKVRMFNDVNDSS